MRERTQATGRRDTTKRGSRKLTDLPQDSQPIDPPESTRPAILILNRDLFFGVRLRQALLANGWLPRIVPSAGALVAAIADGPSPHLVIVDMAATPDWSLIEQAAGDTIPATPVLAFGPHKDVDGFRAAKAGGATRVVSNGDFHRDMIGFVRRYARPAEEPAPDGERTTKQAGVAENTGP